MRTLLFLLVFLLCSGGALFIPQLGLLGYMVHYIIGPEQQWWARALQQYDIRYSFTLAAMAGMGIFLNSRKLRYGDKLLTAHEKILLAFLGLAWVLHVFSEPTIMASGMDHSVMKLTKVLIFCLMLTHVITNLPSLKALLWTLVLSTLILGVEAYTAPASSFAGGRLEGIGGVDFMESNFLPAFIEAVLPWMGVLFLTSRWQGKIVAILAGVLSINTIILTRSRGALVGFGIGIMVAILLAPKGYRKTIGAGLVVAILGGLYLTDAGFSRRAATMEKNTEEMDLSAKGRLETWRLAVDMLTDHPLGIGPANFFQFAGRYNPKYEGRDTHNTFVRCFTELGIPGFLLFLGIIFHAIVVLRRTMRKALELPPDRQKLILLSSYGLAIGLCMMLGTGFTITLLYTEMLWWFLAMPVCMERIVDNLLEDFRSHVLDNQEGALERYISETGSSEVMLKTSSDNPS